MERSKIQVLSFLQCLGVLLLLSVGCQSGAKTMEVSAAVDFGPANRPERLTRVAVPEKSTAFDALRSAFPVVTSGR